jgi:hypothetical protein
MGCEGDPYMRGPAVGRPLVTVAVEGRGARCGGGGAAALGGGAGVRGGTRLWGGSGHLRA